MKIYTKAGDGGETRLLGGVRVSKDDARVEAYGAVDELNAALGAAAAEIPRSGLDADGGLGAVLRAAQQRLFAVGSRLAAPPGASAARGLPPVEPAWAEELERSIDGWEARLQPLRQFVLPGGTPLAAALHRARAVCRRAERRAVALHRREPVEPAILPYLNRLGDALFVAARLANALAGAADVPWDPGEGRGPA
ncbi:MAG TPA: cob(I)yrinic acid a,c-diamide adenosyltransferase [Anaeromyxobacteraceae bacterium]